MRLTPESKSVLDTLLAGGTLTAANISIGPLDETTRLLLQVLINNYDALYGTHGEQQAETLLKAYLRSVKPGTQEARPISEPSQPESNGHTQSTQETHDPETSPDRPAILSFNTPPRWRLHELRCRSIKGVAPHGEEFPFSFEGKSNLLFGPNGSGKSSLLGAVVWVLTGITLTDAPEQEDIASIHKLSQGATRGSKICDWPPICTLPDTGDPKSVTPDSMAMIQFKSYDGSTTIYLRRTIDKGLEVSLDEQNWTPCTDLSDYGIEPLDLQLSIVAPTVFGRQAIETAPNSRKILSLMLGYDPLENIGDIVSNLARNRTSFFNTLTDSTNTERKILSTKLASLPNLLPDGSPLKKQLETLQSLPRLSLEKIREIRQKVSDQIANSSAGLAKILEITRGDSPVPTALAENLIKAIGYLEKGFSEVCPSLSSIELQSALPQKDVLSSQEQLSNLQQILDSFTSTAQAEIAERLQWWRKETAPASKAKLLLWAAQFYDPAKIECPVCEQSVKDRPVRSELESLRNLDPKLLEDIKLFFSNLVDEINNTVPENLRIIANASPHDRLVADWEQLKTDKLSIELSPIVKDFEAPINQLATGIQTITPEIPEFLPSDVEPPFREFANIFLSEVNSAYMALAILRWASAQLPTLKQDMSHLITAPFTENSSSLFAVLSKGKSAAQEIEPLKMLQTQLSEVETANNNILQNQNKLDNLGNLKEPLDNLKELSKYAVDKTTTVFGEIKDKAIENWKLLYPEASTGLYPSRLVMAGRKDKSIESLLTQGNYEVLGPPFANAGLQRAIALSFLCALFDKHPHGLGFVIFDDPILSLDEDHRERWSGSILSPRMKNTQVILATHQMQFLTKCGHHFANGQIVTLNPRDQKRRISWEPGNYIEKAEKLLQTNCDLVPGVLYNYCEGLLETLDSYSPQAFFIRENFTKSLNDYENLSPPSPLIGTRQKQIVALLKNPTITNVFDARHTSTKHNVTNSNVQDAFAKLKELDNIFRNELENLKRLKARERKGSVIQISTIPFPDIPQAAIFRNPLVFPVLGRAAARPESWVLDSSDEVTSTKFAPDTVIFVSSNTLNPVVRYGQCVLLAHEDNLPEDDDLVAVVSNDGNRYLRKLWSDGEAHILQVIHPTKLVPPIRILKSQAAMRKVIGVLYQTPLTPVMHPSSKTLEWYPFSRFPSEIISNLKTLIVEGDSLEPIARQGQKVIVSEPETPQNTSLRQGGLAALEVEDDDIGNVIKKVYRKSDHWILVSPNPVQDYMPDIVPIQKIKHIKRIWPLRGVLFETTDD